MFDKPVFLRALLLANPSSKIGQWLLFVSQNSATASETALCHSGLNIWVLESRLGCLLNLPINPAGGRK